MIVKTYSDVPAEKVTTAGAQDVTIRWLLGPGTPAPNFHLRLFEAQPGGHSPYHAHPFEHEIFILEGRGRINGKGKAIPVAPGSFALVEPNEEHQVENTGDGVLRFLCLVPIEK
jgi:quercetin dioxygenase-like cupin family protein